MRVYHPEEEMILNDDECKKNDVIDEEGVDCAGVRWLVRYNIPVERLESQWYNKKPHLW